MSADAAHIVLLVITAAAVALWALGLYTVVGAYQARRRRSIDETSSDNLPTTGDWIVGAADVELPAAVCATRAAAALARGDQFGPVKILEKSDDRLVFEKLGPATHPVGRWVQRGLLRLSPTGTGRCRIGWAAELGNMTWLLLLAGLFQVLGVVAIVGGYGLVATYVVASPLEAVRWQVFQMLQTIHFLWPPLLFASLYRRGRREVAAQFEALVNNLPFTGD